MNIRVIFTNLVASLCGQVDQRNTGIASQPARLTVKNLRTHQANLAPKAKIHWTEAGDGTTSVVVVNGGLLTVGEVRRAVAATKNIHKTFDDLVVLSIGERRLQDDTLQLKLKDLVFFNSLRITISVEFIRPPPAVLTISARGAIYDLGNFSEVEVTTGQFEPEVDQAFPNTFPKIEGLYEEGQRACHISYSPDGRYVLVGDRQHVRLYSVRPRKLKRQWKGGDRQDEDGDLYVVYFKPN